MISRIKIIALSASASTVIGISILSFVSAAIEPQVAGLAQKKEYVFYPGTTELDSLNAPNTYDFDSQIIADVDINSEVQNGVILAVGDNRAGFELYVYNSQLKFTYVFSPKHKYTVGSYTRIFRGTRKLSVRIRKTGKDSGRAELFIDDLRVASADIPKMWPMSTVKTVFHCGENRGVSISGAYTGYFPFIDKLHRVLIKVDNPDYPY
jgi:hypothetical protein